MSSQSEALFHFTNQSEDRTKPKEHVLRLKPRVKTNREVGAKNGPTFHRIHHHHRSDPNLFSVVKLRFPIRENYLGTEDRQLSLKCTASVPDLYWRSTEVKMLIRPLHGWTFATSNKPADKHFHLLFLKFVLILVIM